MLDDVYMVCWMDDFVGISDIQVNFFFTITQQTTINLQNCLLESVQTTENNTKSIVYLRFLQVYFAGNHCLLSNIWLNKMGEFVTIGILNKILEGV